MVRYYKKSIKISLLMVLGGLSTAFAQQDLSGTRQYPQFRTTSGLPGSNFTLGPDGKPAPRGALAISIPIAYSLANGVWVGGLNFTGGNMRFRIPKFDSRESDFNGNGTGWLMTGFGGNWGRITASAMVLSSQFDNAFNFVYTPPAQRGPLTFGVGVQDVAGNGGAGGQAVDDVDGGNSRSFFGCGTWDLGKGVFATAGLGTNRFRFGFAGVSWNVDPRWSMTVEHDGYNFNGGVAYRVGKLATVSSRDVFGSFTVGTIRGKYFNVGFAFGF